MLLHVCNLSDIAEKRMYVVYETCTENDMSVYTVVELLDLQTKRQSHLGQLEVSAFTSLSMDLYPFFYQGS